MEMQPLGGTNMRVGVLGFGAAPPLYAGLNVIATAECDLGSEEPTGRAVTGRRRDFRAHLHVVGGTA